MKTISDAKSRLESLLSTTEEETKEKINDTQSGLGYLLRIAATHLCNCHCIFCRPPTDQTKNALTTPQLLDVVKVISDNYQLKTVHFTGGDPLLRKDIVDLVEGCKENTGGLIEMAMTTNGILLPNYIDELARAGLSRINFSFHSLDPIKYQKICNVKFFFRALNGKRQLHKSNEITIR